MLKSLGFVTAAAAGTPERITKNESSPTAVIHANALYITPLSGNTGKIYIGLSTMVVATGVGVLAMIEAPANASTGPFARTVFESDTNGLALNELFIDVQTNGQGALISYSQI
jgi:hypothetical protein